MDLLVISPIIESLVLIGVIELLRKAGLRIAIQIIASVLVVCALHSWQYAFWGFLVAPAFLIDAGTYVLWRRTSFWIGLQMMVALHFICNAFSAIAVIAERLRH